MGGTVAAVLSFRRQAAHRLLEGNGGPQAALRGRPGDLSPRRLPARRGDRRGVDVITQNVGRAPKLPIREWPCVPEY